MSDKEHIFRLCLRQKQLIKGFWHDAVIHCCW